MTQPAAANIVMRAWARSARERHMDNIARRLDADTLARSPSGQGATTRLPPEGAAPPENIAAIMAEDDVPRPFRSDAEAEALGGHVAQNAPDLRFSDPLIMRIVEEWRQRRAMMDAYNRLLLQAGSICRRHTRGDKTEGAKLLKVIRKGGEHEHAEAALYSCYHLFAAMDVLIPPRHAAEKNIARLVKDLPVYDLAIDIRGIGPVALGGIVAECGDLSTYKSVSAVWKRAGLAVINGQRQRRVTGEAALEHGYSPRRRAVFYTFADSMIKAQGTGENAGPYRQIYDRRKEAFAERAKCPAHSHADAMRIMIKAVLKDITVAWMKRKEHWGHNMPPRPNE